MLNKKIKVCSVIILIFMILGMVTQNSIAIIDSTLENDFFYTNKQEISIGETLEMTLDISKTQYDKFEFKLSSNLDTSSIVVNENVETENYNNELSINIDRSKIKLDKITFYYKVPENSQLEAKLKLTAQIMIEEEEEGYKVVENKMIDVKIAENTVDNQEKPNEQTNKESIPNENNKADSLKKEDMTNNSLENINTNKLVTSSKQVTAYSANSSNVISIPSQAETAVYNGSSNNYLSSLEIEGENLNTIFSKENTTYFIHTTGKNELNVNITVEDDNAKVYVTGDKNLKTGDNKILISVTAENGDVRYYRVFVTNN